MMTGQGICPRGTGSAAGRLAPAPSSVEVPGSAAGPAAGIFIRVPDLAVPGARTRPEGPKTR
ncbi:MAG: hypothetical protein AB1921_05345, partial [Thermodesulfobacteriota bacterium]